MKNLKLISDKYKGLLAFILLLFFTVSVNAKSFCSVFSSKKETGKTLNFDTLKAIEDDTTVNYFSPRYDSDVEDDDAGIMYCFNNSVYKTLPFVNPCHNKISTSFSSSQKNVVCLYDLYCKWKSHLN